LAGWEKGKEGGKEEEDGNEEIKTEKRERKK